MNNMKIAEIGWNFMGDMQLAEQMVDAAANSDNIERFLVTSSAMCIDSSLPLQPNLTFIFLSFQPT